MRTCMEELVYLLKAKIQCIWIDTYEEYEVLKDLKEIVSDMNGMKLYTWSFTEGMKRIALSNREQQEPADKKINVERIFQVINEAQENEEVKDESLYVLKDIHMINDDHKIKRSLRDVKEKPSKNYNPIIVVAPIINIPIEHEKLFTVIHYDTPSKEDITKQVNKIVSNIRAAINAGKPYTMPTNEEIKHVIDACVGLTYNEITDVLVKSVVKFKTLSIRAVLEAKVQLVEKSGVLDYKLPQARFNDVGGNNAFKDWIEEVELSMTDEAVAFGCMRSKGYLALGAPGTAKTFLAEAVAQKWGYPLLKLNMSKIMNKLVGESEKKIDQAFRIAKACAPCIMLFDEVEKALSGTKSSNASDAGTTARVFAKVLEFLNDDNGVFVVMTSNDVSQLPPELTRSGRLDAMWYFGLPTEEERKEIFRIHLNNTGKEITEALVDAAAEHSNHYTGAEIKEIVKIAMRKAYRRFKTDGVNGIMPDDVISAIDDVVPIYESSREKIDYLDMWVKGRARYSNGRIDQNGFDSAQDDTLLQDVLNIDELR